MNLPDLFRYCPKCGEERARASGGANPFTCARCHFVYWFNPAVAVAAIIADEQGRILLLKRAKPPCQGLLSLPGGFVDIGESPDNAVRREVREEVNLELSSFQYFAAFPNQYEYRDVTYHVSDFFFTATVDDWAPLRGEAEEVSQCFLKDPAEIDPEAIAFPSIRSAVDRYVRATKRPVRPGCSDS